MRSLLNLDKLLCPNVFQTKCREGSRASVEFSFCLFRIFETKNSPYGSGYTLHPSVIGTMPYLSAYNAIVSKHFLFFWNYSVCTVKLDTFILKDTWLKIMLELSLGRRTSF